MKFISLKKSGLIANIYRYVYDTENCPNDFFKFVLGLFAAIITIPINWMGMIIQFLRNKGKTRREEFPLSEKIRYTLIFYGLYLTTWSIGAFVILASYNAHLFKNVTFIESLWQFPLFAIMALVALIIALLIIVCVVSRIEWFFHWLFNTGKNEHKQKTDSLFPKKAKAYLRNKKDKYCPQIKWKA